MSRRIKIAVIFPSRGLAYSQTCEELLQNLEGYDYDIYFAHGEPLPDCFNKPLAQALNKNYTHIWIVEDDMVLPPFTLTKMLEVNRPVVACDYPVTKAGVGAVQYDSKGRALFSGTGCLLVTTSFIKAHFKQPVFRTDIRWDIHVTREGLELKKRVDKEITYGMHDVTFGLECYRMGKPIHILKQQPPQHKMQEYYRNLGKPFYIGQRKLIQLGAPGTNQGQHLIEVWDKVTKPSSFIQGDLTYKPNTSPLIAFKLKDGTTTNVSEDTAKRLEKGSKGKRIEAGEVGFVE